MCCNRLKFAILVCLQPVGVENLRVLLNNYPRTRDIGTCKQTGLKNC